MIEFENKAAFIGECKIWYGKKQLSETIQQILNYSTWKDVKSSVVIFNKKNKIFKKIIENIDSWVNENAISHSKPQINVWKCRYYREDMLLTIDITIHLFDIYVDENQFQDMRYE